MKFSSHMLEACFPLMKKITMKMIQKTITPRLHGDFTPPNTF
ncbi:hypothetical protein J2129_002643 [Methanofollis sp. W23]|nr:hypothetical protein [Methanofollis sp. W23]